MGKKRNNNAGKGATRRRKRALDTGMAGGSQEGLPALSLLSDLPSFEELSLNEAQQQALKDDVAQLVAEGIVSSEVEPAFVARLDRSFPALVAASGLCRAEFSFRFGVVHEPSCAVGDWVVLRRPSGHDKGVIEFVLPRTNAIARWKGGNRGKKQVLAANVDTVLVAQALGSRPISCNRIARSALIAADCGAAAAVVLTKADRASVEVLEQDITLIREVLGTDVPLALTAAGAPDKKADGVAAACESLEELCARQGVAWGVTGVRTLVPVGQVAIVLGESGAGKSTLLNALLGAGVLATGGVRDKDDAGRHTTVARRMVSIPEAGVIIDEPGLRSLPLVGHERGLALVFPEIDQAAQACRFRDCTHTHEPGCAVRAALREGRFSPARLEAYLALAEEMRQSKASLDPDISL